MQSSRSNRTSLLIIFFTIFIDLIGIGILFPIIPQLLGNPASEYYLLPAGYSLDQGYILLGFLVASFPLAQFFAAPILGQLSDIHGRKKILVLSLGGTCLSYVLFAIAIIQRNIPLLFASRILDGITGGNISVAQAAIADITTPENRAKNFGLIGAAFGLGFVIGPYIGGKLSDPTLVSWFHAATPFWFAACLSALNVIFITFLFRETNTRASKKSVRWGKAVRDIIRAYGLKELRPLFFTNFFFQGGFTFFTTFFGVFLVERFAYDQGNIGDLFAYIGIWIAFTQAVLTRALSGVFTERQIVRVGLPATGVMILLLLLPLPSWWLFIDIPFFAMANGLSQSNFMAILSRTASQDIQGEVLGINASVMALAQAFPPILSGYIAAHLTSEAPIVVATVVILAGGIFFALSHRTKRV